MALARFFPRVANGAAAVLAGFDAEDFARTLMAQRVELAFDRNAAGTTEGRASLDLCVRLLARLYPVIQITGLGAGLTRRRAKLVDLARRINPAIQIDIDRAPTARIVVGETAAPGEHVVYGGSDGWICRLCTTGPVGCGTSENPLGAGAAACLANANVFRAIFRDQLPAAEPDKEVAWSLWDHTVGKAATSQPGQVRPDLGRLALVGAGAIGNGTLWALARYGGLKGVLDVIDPEPVDVSNLQRYVLALDADETAAKVDLASREAAGSDLVVEPHGIAFDQYLAQQGHTALACAAVALDTAQERIRVQGALPGRILNSWTQGGDLGVSRHHFGDGPCLACLYMSREPRASDDERVAEAIGLPEPEHRMQIRHLLTTGAPVGEEFIRLVAERLNVAADRLLPFSGEALRTFYADAICGGLIIGRKGDPQKQVPLAFQSTLAGVMLAAEIVADAAGRPWADVRNKTVVDVLRPLGSWLNLPVARVAPDAPARCLCHDADFLAAHGAKHGKGCDGRSLDMETQI